MVAIQTEMSKAQRGPDEDAIYFQSGPSQSAATEVSTQKRER